MTVLDHLHTRADRTVSFEMLSCERQQMMLRSTWAGAAAMTSGDSRYCVQPAVGRSRPKAVAVHSSGSMLLASTHLCVCNQQQRIHCCWLTAWPVCTAAFHTCMRPAVITSTRATWRHVSFRPTTATHVQERSSRQSTHAVNNSVVSAGNLLYTTCHLQ